MNNCVSRRSFLKTAGLAAGTAAAARLSPLAYAQNESVRVACIGVGGQGSFHLRDGLARAEGIQVVAVCDVYVPHLESGHQIAGGEHVAKFIDYREMLDKVGSSIDAVVIATPLDTHFQIAMDCLDAGKWVFCEKTLCQTIEQARKLVERSHGAGKFVQVGHQRRYNPIYNHALQLALEDGALGRITHLGAQWHRNSDWRRPLPKRELTAAEKAYIPDLERHLNWRLYRDRSGGLMTELASHQLDVANWFLGTVPTRVIGYGGLDYWRDGRDVFDNVNLVFEYEIAPGSVGFRSAPPRTAEQRGAGQMDKPYSVRLTYSSILANARLGASESIEGDEGSFVLSEGKGLFYREATARVAWAEDAKKDADTNAIVITSGGTRMLSSDAETRAEPVAVDTTKSVDQLQFEAFAHDIRNGGTPRANALVGLQATVCALAGLQAIHERREVPIDPAWLTFDFAPDPTAGYGA